ncbi:MOSC domain-containing protein ['Osedax' symbiont bacterium Rs2_46_30_T18]|nr:MOSC domain-containing protein ['Osedax' symbiont bacterium Rs2_46_30_T18]
MSRVLGLSINPQHQFSKPAVDAIELICGEGIVGDAHRGTCVKHRSRVKVDPTQANLRQVHLIHYELLEELREQGYAVDPGTMGENITTSGIDLLALPRDTKLLIGSSVVISLTGLRNPCAQLDDYQSGLTKAVLSRDDEGNIVRKAGVMAVVEQGGMIVTGDKISVEYPAKPFSKLQKV